MPATMGPQRASRMSRTRARIPLLTAGVVLASGLQLGLAAAAQATAGVAPDQLVTLTDFGVQARGAVLASDAHANTTAIWRETSTRGAASAVLTSYRPAGGAWQPPERLSTTEARGNPVLAVSDNGDAVAAWASGQGDDQPLMVARRMQGRWLEARPLPGRADVDGVSAAMDPGGHNGVVAWSETRTTRGAHSVWAVRVSGTAFSPVHELDSGLSADPRPDVGVAGDGSAFAVWHAATPDGKGATLAARMDASGVWTASQALSNGTPTTAGPLVAVAPSGAARALWTETVGGHRVVVSRTGAGDGTWSVHQLISHPDGDAGTVGLAVGRDGFAVAAWNQRVDRRTRVLASQALPGRAWSSPVDVAAVSGPADEQSDASSSGPVSVAVNADREAVVAWTHTAVHTARLKGGTWLPQDLTAGFWEPQAPAVTSSGEHDFAVAYARQHGINTQYELHVQTLDATQPTVTDLPAVHTALGDRTRLSVRAYDAWSPELTITWDLGDGTNATGPCVQHTYQDPGSYWVSVTVTDGAGNTTTRFGTVEVVAPAA